MFNTSIMQRTIKYIVIILFTAITFSSCNDRVTLQRYFVDNQELGNFTAVDLPATILNLDEVSLSEDQKEAYKSVKRLNFLGYKIDESDLETYHSELTKVKTILKNKKYNDLIEFSDKGKKVVVKYLGTDEEAEEVIVFGSSKDLGFGIVRVLGNGMNPEKMITLVNAVRASDMDQSQLENISSFFK